MSKKWTRIAAFALAVVVTLGAFPASASAATKKARPKRAEDEQTVVVYMGANAAEEDVSRVFMNWKATDKKQGWKSDAKTHLRLQNDKVASNLVYLERNIEILKEAGPTQWYHDDNIGDKINEYDEAYDMGYNKQEGWLVLGARLDGDTLMLNMSPGAGHVRNDYNRTHVDVTKVGGWRDRAYYYDLPMTIYNAGDKNSTLAVLNGFTHEYATFADGSKKMSVYGEGGVLKGTYKLSKAAEIDRKRKKGFIPAEALQRLFGYELFDQTAMKAAKLGTQALDVGELSFFENSEWEDSEYVYGFNYRVSKLSLLVLDPMKKGVAKDGSGPVEAVTSVKRDYENALERDVAEDPFYKPYFDEFRAAGSVKEKMEAFWYPIGPNGGGELSRLFRYDNNRVDDLLATSVVTTLKKRTGACTELAEVHEYFLRVILKQNDWEYIQCTEMPESGVGHQWLSIIAGDKYYWSNNNYLEDIKVDARWELENNSNVEFYTNLLKWFQERDK